MNLKNIYITGMDCTGKSTFAKMYSEASGIPILKFSKPENKRDADDQLKQYEALALCKTPFIMDRAWNGRYAYSGSLNQHGKESPEQILDICINLNKKFVENGGTIFYFHAALDTRLLRMNERGDEYKATLIRKEDSIKRNYEHIMYACHSAGIPFYSIDTSFIINSPK